MFKREKDAEHLARQKDDKWPAHGAKRHPSYSGNFGPMLLASNIHGCVRSSLCALRCSLIVAQGVLEMSYRSPMPQRSPPRSFTQFGTGESAVTLGDGERLVLLSSGNSFRPLSILLSIQMAGSRRRASSAQGRRQS